LRPTNPVEPVTNAIIFLPYDAAAPPTRLNIGALISETKTTLCTAFSPARALHDLASSTEALCEYNVVSPAEFASIVLSYRSTLASFRRTVRIDVGKDSSDDFGPGEGEFVRSATDPGCARRCERYDCRAFTD
jgi:hypothetical protein